GGDGSQCHLEYPNTAAESAADGGPGWLGRVPCPGRAGRNVTGLGRQDTAGASGVADRGPWTRHLSSGLRLCAGPAACRAKPMNSKGGLDPGPVVVKVGGSLFDLQDLGPRLHALLTVRPQCSPLLVPGGGAVADVVRALDRRHQLGEETSHWLALQAMSL